MAEENTGTMNLDLNLGPGNSSNYDNDSEQPVPGSYRNIAVHLEDWLDDPTHRVREVFSMHRNQRWRSVWRQIPIPRDTQNLALELISGSEPQTGEGSVAKICEIGAGFDEHEALCKKKDGGNGHEGSFFDCNICLDLAKDPVVTCCGHLFCWPCLYRWLHHHSDAKECPVCKGEVTTKNVTPIYGRGCNSNPPESDLDFGLKIPSRPQARRVESWRQTSQRTAFTIPMEEMIRRLGSTFDLSRELARSSEGVQESPERSTAFLNRILTSRGLRRERTPAALSNYHRTVINSSESVAAERIVESYFHGNQGVPLPVDDRDSLSSIAAVIHSESQTVDNAIEIDSTVSLSTSSSRRRNDASRISDVDSGDSRAPRRRRLH